MIKMVRSPSDTPNIRNVDDFIFLRHAYGNQDGFINGKGNELSYSVNGSEFRIDSGRIVLQGVESDIDANGVVINVDVVNETRYYSVYYNVNLATNLSRVLSVYDTAGYPEINKGDDLIENSSGTANLELYRFTATNGVISNVQKSCKPIKYINEESSVFNALNINGMPLKRDENGVLKIGNTIIPQKRVLWENTSGLEVSSNIYITLSENVNEGDTLEITMGVSTSVMTYKVLIIKNRTFDEGWVFNVPDFTDIDQTPSQNVVYSKQWTVLMENLGTNIIYLGAGFQTNTSNDVSHSGAFPVYYYRISKIIE